jgi:hypothetical protein
MRKSLSLTVKSTRAIDVGRLTILVIVIADDAHRRDTFLLQSLR